MVARVVRRAILKIKAQAYPNALRSLIKGAGYRFCEVQQETGNVFCGISA
jgi:Arc/MetJ family transcription regulator